MNRQWSPQALFEFGNSSRNGQTGTAYDLSLMQGTEGEIGIGAWPANDHCESEISWLWWCAQKEVYSGTTSYLSDVNSFPVPKMRLQISIQRNALPTINILFSTGSGPSSKTSSSSSTIADLLHDVNELVPLESSDGEWGLEDYVVELQATLDQEKSYECLHFQTIKSVFREDDEVIVRGLASEDLKSRRLGGRNQIHRNGAHLIDGVPFGKRRLRTGGRPGIYIPPRKRRRLAIGQGDKEDYEEGENQTRLLQLMEAFEDKSQDMIVRATNSPTWAAAEKAAREGRHEEAEEITASIFTDLDMEEEDDEEDGDFDTFTEDDEGSELSDESDKMEEPLLIKATAEFDDADTEEDDVDGDASQDSEDSDGQIETETGLELSDELKALLAEVEALSDHDDIEQPASERQRTPSIGKRKHATADERENEEETDFEGFSTPAKKLNLVDETSSHIASSDMNDDESASSTVVSNAEMQIDLADAEGFTSSSGSSDSSDSSDSEETTDSDSSDSDISSSPGDSDSNDEVNTINPANKAVAKTTFAGIISSSSSSFLPKNVGIPGQGSPGTKKNNQRMRKRKRLLRLKREGKLPESASFADMRTYDEKADLDACLETKKEALLQQLNTESQELAIIDASLSFIGPVRPEEGEERIDINVTEQAEDGEPPVLPPASEESIIRPEAKVAFTNHQPGAQNIDSILDESQATKGTPPLWVTDAKATSDDQQDGSVEAKSDSAQRRSRLDAASSRRLIFGSLGLRNPKTPAGEQAIREKLAKFGKKPPKRDEVKVLPERSRSPPAAEQEGPDAWKEKIELSAVECELEGVELAPPPFPFHQGWDETANRRRGLGKKRGRNQAQYYGGYHQENYDDGDYEEGGYEEYAPDISTLQAQGLDDAPAEQEHQLESRTLSMEDVESDDMPRPINFQTLPILTRSEMGLGMIIAFKELDMENFQPVISAYRVARVTDIPTEDSSGEMELLLSKRDWRAPVTLTYDAESGKRILTNHEVAIDDEQLDDGVRLRRFEELVEPRVVDGTSVQVAASAATGFDGSVEVDVLSNIEQDTWIIPNSEEASKQPLPRLDATNVTTTERTTVEVNTPRRHEITAIIKEAPFTSAIDEQLLQEQSTQEEPMEQSSPAFNTRSHRSGRSMGSPAPAPATASSNTKPISSFGTSRFNGWDSSPVRGPECESYDPEDEEGVSPKPSKGRSQNNMGYLRLGIDASSVGSSQQDAQRVDARIDLDSSNLHFETNTQPMTNVADDEVVVEEDEEEGGAIFNTDLVARSEVPPSHDQSPAKPDNGGKGKAKSQAKPEPASRGKRKASKFLEQRRGRVPSPGGSVPESEEDGEIGSSAGGSVSVSDSNPRSYPNNGASHSDSSLPSLRELTSSQVQKITASSRGSRVSPPPLGRGLRNRKTRSMVPEAEDLKARMRMIKTRATSDELDELSMTRRIKGSSSQSELRLSQIPSGMQMVDLTFSSGPVASDSDGEYRAGGRGRAERGKRGGSHSQSQRSATEDGIGKRRLLTSKKMYV